VQRVDIALRWGMISIAGASRFEQSIVGVEHFFRE
jgi:hypothetical protein